MRVLKYKYAVKADIEHVFSCHRNLDFACKTINQHENTNGFKAIRKGDELHIVGSGSKVIAKEVESRNPSFLKMQLTPTTKKMKWFGVVAANCNFSQNRDTTTVTVEFESDKNPSFFWRIFIQVIAKSIHFQSRRYEKQVIKAIEQSA